jgi:hypothetical protein
MACCCSTVFYIYSFVYTISDVNPCIHLLSMTPTRPAFSQHAQLFELSLCLRSAGAVNLILMPKEVCSVCCTADNFLLNHSLTRAAFQSSRSVAVDWCSMFSLLGALPSSCRNIVPVCDTKKTYHIFDFLQMLAISLCKAVFNSIKQSASHFCLATSWAVCNTTM